MYDNIINSIHRSLVSADMNVHMSRIALMTVAYAFDQMAVSRQIDAVILRARLRHIRKQRRG